MVRLSDFSDKERHQPRKKEPSRPAPAPKPALPPTPAPPVSAAVPVGLDALYEQLTACATRLLDQVRRSEPLELPSTLGQAHRQQSNALDDVRALIEQLPSAAPSARDAIPYFLLEKHNPENYLCTHAVNVALLANLLGRCWGYTGAPLYEVTLAGLLLDIGMAGEGEQLAAQPRRLTTAERDTLAGHPASAVERLSEVPNMSASVLEAVAAHHEREDGSGYPKRLAGDAIPEYAKILAVCDVYDALTHPRSYRTRFSPAEAVKTLIGRAGAHFDRRVVKLLIDQVSLYPRGSLIRLSTNEIGVIQETRPNAPLRPRVRISYDETGRPIQTPRDADLLEQRFLSIKGIVREGELAE